jgi:hypothetical protein
MSALNDRAKTKNWINPSPPAGAAMEPVLPRSGARRDIRTPADDERDAAVPIDWEEEDDDEDDEDFLDDDEDLDLGDDDEEFLGDDDDDEDFDDDEEPEAEEA